MAEADRKTSVSHGAYYTPPNIVRLIVENTLGRLCDDLEASENTGTLGIPTTDTHCARQARRSGTLDLHILDPACGDGAFLSGAYSYLQARYPDATTTEIQRCLYGVDIDPLALDRAASMLPAANLVLGDAILDPETENGRSARGVDWHRLFPGIMARGGFDAVIGNPPWVSLSGRFGSRAYSDAEVAFLRQRFGGNSYMPNVFEYFIARGLELTRPEGYFSFIVPDRLASNKHFAELRRRLLTQTEVILLIYGVPFPGATADTLIFVFRKAEPKSGTLFRAIEHDRFTLMCSQDELLQHAGCEFPTPLPPAVAKVIQRIEQMPGRIRLGDVCQCTSGFGGKSHLIDDNQTSDTQIPVFKGSSVGRYQTRKTYWFDFRRENLTGRTSDPAKLGASPKVLIRKTGSRLVATYDASGTYPEQSLYFLHGNRSDLDLRFVLGILNSRLIDVYYRARCLTNWRTIAQVKKADLDRIPLPAIDMSLSKHKMLHDRLVEAVDRMLELNKQLGCGAKSDIACEINMLDEEIERITRQLYGFDEHAVDLAQAIEAVSRKCASFK